MHKSVHVLLFHVSLFHYPHFHVLYFHAVHIRAAFSFLACSVAPFEYVFELYRPEAPVDDFSSCVTASL